MSAITRTGYGYPRTMGALPEIDRTTVIKWVVVPGATVALLYFVTRMIRKRRRQRR